MYIYICTWKVTIKYHEILNMKPKSAFSFKTINIWWCPLLYCPLFVWHLNRLLSKKNICQITWVTTCTCSSSIFHKKLCTCTIWPRWFWNWFALTMITFCRGRSQNCPYQRYFWCPPKKKGVMLTSILFNIPIPVLEWTKEWFEIPSLLMT